MAEEPGAQRPAATDADASALEQRAAEVLQAAEEVAAATGRAMVSEAKGVRQRILQDATRRRSELVAELERVQGLLERALAALRVPMDPAGSERAPSDATDESAAIAGAALATGGPAANDVFALLRSAKPVARPAARPGGRRRSTRARADPDGAPRDESGAATNDLATGDLATGDLATGDDPAEAGTPANPSADPSGAPSGAPSGGSPQESAAAPSDPDDAHRRRRDAVLDPLVPDAIRAAKRVLQDEQNSLLDAIRRARGRYEPSRLLPEHEHQREAWVSILTPSMDAAFLGGRAAAGKTGRVTSAPARVVGHALAVVVTQLRDRLSATIETVVAEGPYESPHELHRALGSALGARYREWKGSELEARLRDAACAAYARGSFEAAGAGTPLRWVPADPGRCPDCDDNALEPTVKGSPFPTGQSHPPAHPGCRCLVLPLKRGESATANA